MKKLLAIFLFFSVFLFANDFTNQEESVFTESSEDIAKPLIAETYSAKNLYLSYVSYPKHIYKNQRFEVKVKALITRKDYDSIETNFLNSKNMTPLNPDSLWKESTTSADTYFNTFYFKAYEKDFIMPTIEVKLFKAGILIEARKINPQEISFSDIAKGDERFTNVIAKYLNVIASKTKQYNNHEVLTIIDINAKNSNLEDFYIKGFEEQGFTVIEDNYPNQHIIYYLVIPIHKKSIIFNYYNSISKKFEKVVLPIVLEEDLVSTQTDLNPNNSSFEFYKKIAVGVFALLLLLLFIWKRKFYILVMFLLVSIVFILFIMPNKKITLKENTVIYILPTKNSTIFQKLNGKTVVEEMKRKDGFVKIMFGRGSENYIGWIKEEDVSKN